MKMKTPLLKAIFYGIFLLGGVLYMFWDFLPYWSGLKVSNEAQQSPNALLIHKSNGRFQAVSVIVKNSSSVDVNYNFQDNKQVYQGGQGHEKDDNAHKQNQVVYRDGQNTNTGYERFKKSQEETRGEDNDLSEELDRVKLNSNRDISFILEGAKDVQSNFLRDGILKMKLQKIYSTFINNKETSSYKNHNLNATTSRSISLSRSISETRSEACIAKYTENRTTSSTRLQNLKVSIVIPFHNEEYSIFLRGLHSIYHTSPMDLLHEVILIDDSSTFQNLKDTLEQYVTNFPKLKLYRTNKREGLIRARLLGAMISTGNVLIFLDAHIECQKHWLEPLLDIIMKNPKTIAIPTVDFISPDDLTYRNWYKKEYGTFSWELDYVWKGIKAFPTDETEPISSATMIGCAMAIMKDTFISLGSYDEDMWIWGGENLELSFRIWLCGGGIQLAPCSHIGHLFRSHLPYSFPITNVINKNLQRVAEVWMGRYKKYYYLTTGKVVPFSEAEKVTLRQRKEFMKTLNCKPFSWYLENVAKLVDPPPNNAVLFGQMKNIAVNLCLSHTGAKFSLQNCPLLEPQQNFYYTNGSLLVHYNTGKCLQYGNSTKGSKTLEISECNVKSKYQKWIFDPVVASHVSIKLYGVDTRKPIGVFRANHDNFKGCLSAVFTKAQYIGNYVIPPQYDVIVEYCNANKHQQFWIFTHKIIKGIKYNDPLM